MIKSIFKMSTLFALVLSISMSAFAGKDRGGGNAFEPEFKQIGRDLVTDIKQAGLTSEQIGFEVVRLEIALDEIRIIGTDGTLKIENYPRQAINSPIKKTILFSNSTWAILNPYQKKLLVLHEYLRFVGVDDSEYAYSLRIIQLLKDPAQAGNGAVRPSARATIYKLLRSAAVWQGQLGDFPYASAIIYSFYAVETKTHQKYVLDFTCGYDNKLFVRARGDVAAPGFPLSPVEKVISGPRTTGNCDRMIEVLRISSQDSPVKLILDPVRALDSPNDYLTIQF